jgi:hypothetical protein
MSKNYFDNQKYFNINNSMKCKISRDLREIALLTIFCAISHYNSFDSCGVTGPQMYEKIKVF